MGVLAVLHTWDQQFNLHPHVHCLVSGGGISDDGSTVAARNRNVADAQSRAVSDAD